MITKFESWKLLVGNNYIANEKVCFDGLAGMGFREEMCLFLYNARVPFIVCGGDDKHVQEVM